MNNDPLIIKLENVRLSFPSLHEKKAFKDGKPAYQATFLLDKKTNAASIAKVQAAMAHLVKEEFGGKALPPDRVCLRDGATKPDIEGYGPGVLFVSSRNEKTKPGVVDNNLNEIVAGDAGDPYAGCYVNATVRLWPQGGKSFKSEFGKRINATLRNVQVLLRNGKPYGEPFGERQTPANEEFEAVEENVDSGV